MLLYQITNLGVGVYTYSWYGLAAWRAPYLIFSVMYFIVCYVIYVSWGFLPGSLCRAYLPQSVLSKGCCTLSVLR
ncbi:unnamed protein product [Trichobilharzia szidati]|nr:unnamed protein product [Trichobilharzia szidati]